MSVSSIGEIAWVLGIVAWYFIRRPYERRAKRVRVVSHRRSTSEMLGLAAALLGLAIIPLFYVATGIPEGADHPARLWAVVVGAAYFLSGHVGLSQNPQGTRAQLVDHARDSRQAEPDSPRSLRPSPPSMYTSFLLMGVGQAVSSAELGRRAGGLAGFAVLFLLRVTRRNA